MAVSPVLNDLALAAATDRTSASKKASPKSRDGDFNSTLSVARRENEDAARSSKSSPQPRPQVKHDLRDHRATDAQQAGAQQAGRARPETDKAHADAPRDAQRHETRAERGQAPDRSEPKDGAIEQDSSVSASDQTATKTVSKSEDSAAPSAESGETKSLDESSLVQIVAPVIPQLIQTQTIPVEVQIAALLDGAKIEVPKAGTSETLADEARPDQVQDIANSTIGSGVAGKIQASLKPETDAAKNASSEADNALLATTELTTAQSAAKTVAADKSKPTDADNQSTKLEIVSSQANQATTERDMSFAARVATKTAFSDAIAASTADKAGDGVAGISAAPTNGTAEQAHALKAPVASASEALARADAPVPLQAVAVEIGMRAMRGSKEFSIRLDPEDLGRIDIKLEISEAGEVQAKLVVERVETLQLLQRDAKTLERAFDQAGLKTNPDGLQFSLKDPGQQRDGQHNQQSERSKFNAAENDMMAIEETTLRTFHYTSPATSGLDIRI